MPWALGCVSREGGRVAIDLHPRGAVARVERGERGRNELKGIFEGNSNVLQSFQIEGTCQRLVRAVTRPF